MPAVPPNPPTRADPSPSPSPTVLVTGASGFTAVWIVKALLEQDYGVRGTVRSASKGEYLQKLYAADGFGPDRFEYVVVDDMSKDGAFDEAVKGVDAVMHTAAPFPAGSWTLDEFFGPSVKGTVGIMESILKYSPTVKRVIYTSSIATIIRWEDIPPLFTEEMWHERSLKVVEEMGNDAPWLDCYRASKTTAERGAWEFMKRHEGKLSFDLVTIQPPMVYGPIIHDVPTLSGLNISSVDFYRVLTGQIASSQSPLENWVDVRDVAEAHVRALVVPQAAGHRFIVSAGHYDMQDFLDAIHAPPDEAIFARVPRGTPSAGKTRQYRVNLDTTKAREILGITFRTVEEAAKDIARSLLEVSEREKW